MSMVVSNRKGQEHIYIGFLLTKTQLSPDDHDDDDDDDSFVFNDYDDDDAFTLPCTYKSAIKSRVVDPFQEKCW